MKLFLHLSLALAAWPVLAQDPEVAAPERVPIHVKIDSALIQDLSDDQKAALDLTLQQLQTSYWTWGSRPAVEAPTSVFTDGVVPISFKDLFQQPVSEDEVRASAGLPLNEEQKQQVKDEGLYIVPSVKFPGRNNVWQYKWYVQHGIKNIQISFEKNQQAGLNRIVVGIYDRALTAGPLSYGNAAKHILVKTVGNLLRGLVGLKAEQAAYRDDDIVDLLRSQTFEAMKRTLKDRGGLDWRLYDPEISKALVPALGALEANFTQKWVEEEKALRSELLMADSQITVEALTERLTKARNAAFIKTLRASSYLNDFDAQIRELLVERFRAQKIIQKADTEFWAALAASREQVTEQLRQKHPWLSRSARWLTKAVDKATASDFERLWRHYFGGVAVDLHQLGLKQESAVFDQSYQYMMATGIQASAQLAREKKVAREYLESETYWNPQSWPITRTDNPGGKTHYYAERHHNVRVDSGTPLWRVWLFLARTRVHFMNFQRAVLLSGAWKGFNINGLGIEALFSKDSLYKKYDVNDEGQIVGVETAKRESVWSLQRKWIASLDAAMARDFAEAKNAPVSEVIYRKWAYFKNYLTYAPMAYFGVPVGLPVVNALACPVLGAAASICATVAAPLVAGLQWSMASLLADFDDPYREHKGAALSPVVASLLRDFTILGWGQAVVNTLVGVTQVGTGTAKYLGAPLKRVFNVQWDKWMRKILGVGQKNPGGDTAMARRIEGPGLAHDYYYQIKPELVVVALQAWLEAQELQIANARHLQDVNEPLTFAAGVEKALGRELPPAARASIAAGVEPYRKAIDEVFRQANEKLPRVKEFGSAASRTRLIRADLEQAVTQSVPLVRQFLQNKIEPLYGTDHAAAFWRNVPVQAGDYVGLTEWYLSEIFGDEFLTPLEDIDQSFRIATESAPGMQQVAENTVKGVSSFEWSEPLPETVHKRLLVQSRNQVTAAPLRADLLQPCERVLWDAAKQAHTSPRR